MKLNELVLLSNKIESMLVDTGGEINLEIETALAMKDAALPDKVESYGHLIEKTKHAAQFYAKKANELIKISEGCDKLSDALLGRIDTAMNEMQVDQIAGHDYQFKRVMNPVSLVISDAEKVPDKFKQVKTETVIMKTEVKNAMKLGEIVPGCEFSQGYRIKLGPNKK